MSHIWAMMRCLTKGAFVVPKRARTLETEMRRTRKEHRNVFGV